MRLASLLQNQGFQKPEFRAWGSHVSTRDPQPAALPGWRGWNIVTSVHRVGFQSVVPSNEGLPCGGDVGGRRGWGEVGEGMVKFGYEI